MRHIAEVVRLALLAQVCPDGGAQTVGADQGRPFDAAAVGGLNDDVVAAILEAGGCYG